MSRNENSDAREVTTMRRAHHVKDQAVEHLEHRHEVDYEGVHIQLRAVERAIEEVVAAIDALAASVPGGVPAAVVEHLDSARWALRQIR